MHLLGYLFLDYGYLDSAKKYLLPPNELAKEITNEKVIAQNYRLLAVLFIHKYFKNNQQKFCVLVKGTF
jgi:hypothetical protein